jgi:hypothetical protein
MLADRLRKAWDNRRKSMAVDAVMRFSEEGLVLGAGTILSAASHAGRDVSINPDEPRLVALLSAAHQRRPATNSLLHLRKAAERWNDGEDALAAMHLALSRLDRLKQPEADAHRLFLADGLLNNGVEADTITAAIEANAADIAGLDKYSPDQPRVPAGSGQTSGEWTATGAGAPSAQRSPGSPAAAHPARPAPGADDASGSRVGGRGSETAHLQTAVFAGDAVNLLPASTSTLHNLSFTTFDGGPNDPAGWTGAFKLDKPTAVGGVVIQRIDTATRQTSEPPRRSTYWEALAYIPPGATSSGVWVDDSWTAPPDGTHGSETTTATAIFYEGLTMATLPSVFESQDRREFGSAFATSDDPTPVLPRPSSTTLVRTGTLRY